VPQRHSHKTIVFESLGLLGFFFLFFSFLGFSARTSRLADGKAWTDPRYLNLKALSWLGTWDEDYQAFVLGHAFTTFASVSDLKVIDFANFYRLGWERSSAAIASATAAAAVATVSA
jgi:hypothetical protein